MAEQKKKYERPKLTPLLRDIAYGGDCKVGDGATVICGKGNNRMIGPETCGTGTAAVSCAPGSGPSS
jgi:hypothetical protein